MVFKKACLNYFFLINYTSTHICIEAVVLFDSSVCSNNYLLQPSNEICFYLLINAIRVFNFEQLATRYFENIFW